MSLVRANPWRRFPSSQGEAALRWVQVGNVAVLVHEASAPRDSRGRFPVSVWAQTLPLLHEARDFLKVPPSAKIELLPYPHLIMVSGLPCERALAACGHKKDTRPTNARRHDL